MKAILYFYFWEDGIYFIDMHVYIYDHYFTQIYTLFYDTNAVLQIYIICRLM